jgi:hypothetical protein
VHHLHASLSPIILTTGIDCLPCPRWTTDTTKCSLKGLGCDWCDHLATNGSTVCNNHGTCIGSGLDPFDLGYNSTAEQSMDAPMKTVRCLEEEPANGQWTTQTACNLGFGFIRDNLDEETYEYQECRICKCFSLSGTVAPNCIDVFEQITYTLGGFPGLVFIAIGIIVGIGAMFYGLCRIPGCPGYRSKDQKYGLGQLVRKHAATHASFDGLDTFENGSGSEVMLGLNVMSVIMRDVNLPQHIARFYMHGLNAPASPLVLTLTPADRRKVAHLVDMGKFDLFVDEFNCTMEWPKRRKFVYMALQYFMPPVAVMYLQANRRQLVAKVLHLIAEYDYHCFLDARVRDLQNSLKVGFSPDHTTVFLDVLDLDYSEARAGGGDGSAGGGGVGVSSSSAGAGGNLNNDHSSPSRTSSSLFMRKRLGRIGTHSRWARWFAVGDVAI